MVHFEILREYLRLEFVSCADQITFDFDADRVADDWVLLCILLGNDYVPKLPNFEFDLDILSVLCDAYREFLGHSNGMFSFLICHILLTRENHASPSTREITYTNQLLKSC